MALLDVVEDTAGADRGELLIITDQSDTRTATDGELHRGVLGRSHSLRGTLIARGRRLVSRRWRRRASRLMLPGRTAGLDARPTTCCLTARIQRLLIITRLRTLPAADGLRRYRNRPESATISGSQLPAVLTGFVTVDRDLHWPVRLVAEPVTKFTPRADALAAVSGALSTPN